MERLAESSVNLLEVQASVDATASRLGHGVSRYPNVAAKRGNVGLKAVTASRFMEFRSIRNRFAVDSLRFASGGNAAGAVD